MANWSNPALTSTYTDFLSELKARDTDLALQFDGTTSSNLATGTIRWNSTANRWQKWSGSAWAELTVTYALTALTTTGNASVGGTLAVTGATTLAAATATTPATGNNSTALATTAYVRAQAYAPLASPALTGTPTVPTATVNTNTTQAASTAFVQAEIANDAPSKTGTGASGTWGISVSGNAATVTTNANLTGDVTSVGNATSIAAGVIVNNNISASAAIADTKLATISTAGKVSNSATTATNANTASAIVARDASGNFAAGDITAGDIALQNRLVMNASAANYGQFQRIADTGSNITATTGTIVFKFKSALSGSHRSAFVKINLSGRCNNGTPSNSPACEYAFQLHQTSGGICSINGTTTIFEYTFVRATHFAFADLGSGECTVTLTTPVALSIIPAYMVEINTQAGTFGLDAVTIT
jgi:hypothetical protein